jgi:hypothetical protein
MAARPREAAVAITVQSPYVFASDLVTLREASALFAECGPARQASPQTLRRWAVKHGVTLERVGKDDMASWTELLKVHAAEVDRREAGGKR